jgi:hypothetical protein
MAELFHVNKYKYNDEITIEERHYEWFNTTERIIDGGICYPKYRRTYTKMVGVSSKTNKEVTHDHNTYMDLLDELKRMGYKIDNSK